ncbi:hypothetical protein BSKO_12340 [Bryopsis sp. KO-2023]|nr:hypothetical protein BSKO_12340 [Bryopsis sp. KO-2023]
MAEFDAGASEKRRARVTTTPLRKKTARRRRGVPMLQSWQNIPDYLRDNEFIKSGYRANWSFRDSLLSLFLLHNETGNIWSHLLGFLIFAHLTVYVATSPPSPQPLESLWDSVHSVNSQFGEGVHNLQESLTIGAEGVKVALHESLVALHGSLDSRGAAIKSQLQEQLEVAKESVHDIVDLLKRNLNRSLESLSEGIHSAQENIEHLTGTLGHVKENLEKSFGGLHDSLHHLQDALSGNLDAVRGTVSEKLSKSFATLQESLHHFQEILGFPHEGEAIDSSTQCPVQEYTIPGNFNRPVTRWPIFVFMAGAMMCMLISSTCHLFGCCSRHSSTVIWRIDYMGIALLIVASFFPPVYYGFMCHPYWRLFYLTTVSVLGLCVMIVCFLPKFQTPEYRTLRAKLFSGLGVSGVIPIIHQVFINGDEPAVRLAIVYMGLMGITYLFGAVLFATRVPERFYPGAFDIMFHSHQLFHLTVVVAAFLHFRATMILLDWRESTGGCIVLPS